MLRLLFYNFHKCNTAPFCGYQGKMCARSAPLADKTGCHPGQQQCSTMHFVTWKLAINTFWDHFAFYSCFPLFLALLSCLEAQKYGTVKTNYKFGFCLQDCQLIQRQGKPISVDMKGNMRLPQASEEDNGKYTCLIDINLDGRNYTASRSILLTVKDGKYCRALILNP